jgi:hypothetical protein
MKHKICRKGNQIRMSVKISDISEPMKNAPFFQILRDSSMRFFCLKWFRKKYPTGPMLCDLSSLEHRFEFTEKFNFKSPCALWACTANLVVHYGPLRQTWLYVISHWIGFGSVWNDAMVHCARFGYALWALAQDLVSRYGPQHKVWLNTLGHSAAFGCGLEHKAFYQCAELHNSFLKACYIFNGREMLKNSCI